jgi:hypothetical protein
MTAFLHPSHPHIRRHGPEGYAVVESYRPWLRDEFAFRCVYCLFREQWSRVIGAFDIDHFLPVSLHPEHERTYDNLLYTCASCNAVKGKSVVPDPTTVLLDPGVWVTEDGMIHADAPEGARLIELLGLDSPQFTEFRLLWIGIVALAERYDPSLYQRLMGFPADLPDLKRLRPPGGNTRPEGVRTSFFAKRKDGTLPATY